MRRLLIALAGLIVVLATPGSPQAAGKTGCDAFQWPLATELAWMKADDSEQAASGSTLPAPPADKAIALALLPVPEVTFPATPTSTPKPDDAKKFGGLLTFDKLPPGHYQITISTHAWLDVVQNGATLETTGHTGATGCDGIRKSVRFEIGPGPFTIQVSGAPANAIKIAVRPAAD